MRSTAKDRMQKMLVYDRLELPAGRLEVLEEELLAVVSRYLNWILTLLILIFSKQNVKQH